MRKILLSLLIMFSFVLVSCQEITDDYNKAKEPSIELKVEGELTQVYEENEDLEDVSFEIVFKQFTENNINMEDVEINWFIRNQLIEEHSNKTNITQIVNSPGDINVRVEVKFVFEERAKTLEADSLIRVIKTATNILVTNSIDDANHRISVKLGDNNEVEFTGRITGNLKHSVIKWVIQKQTSGEPEIYREFEVDDLENVGGIGITNFTYKFEEPGSYIVFLQTGEGISQDANRYISNSTHINVGYGQFELSTEDEKVLSTNAGITNRVLNVNPLDEGLVGEGVYEWYLNGEKLIHTGLTFTHEDASLGGYLYQVVFNPDDPLIVPLKTDPLLIINGVEVSNETEMLTELDNKTEALILTNDIEYTNEAESLNLDYPVTIYGNGHTLSSKEISIFISVTSNNVYLSNMTIVRANRYNLMFTRVDNGYLEDIKVDELGGGSNPNDFLSGDFGSGVYINKSEVVVNNIEFISGGLVGIRIDNDSSGTSKKASLELIGEFKYNSEDPLFLPIGSGKSSKEGVEVIATGFDYFALPAGQITIRRWDNQGDPVTWEIYDQEKTEYQSGEFLDLFGIGINVDIGFLGLEISNAEGLMFVKMYISMFKEFGTLEITDLEDKVLNTYYIVGETDEVVYGLDKLVYSETKELNVNNQVEPKLPTEPGQYKIKIYISDEFYLGSVFITITE